MKPSYPLTAVLLTALPSFSQAHPLRARGGGGRGADSAPYFVLTGDSTVAVDGGWGDGFLAFVHEPAGGHNIAKSGATTVSFRNEGLWGRALQIARSSRTTYDPVLVTMQFGHNDQKAEKNISSDQFQANLERMSREVRAVGGTPILITSLTRRSFTNGVVIRNLENERQRTIAAATAGDALYLDLNVASTNYVNAVGEADSQLYNWGPGDRTHLNPGGEVVFGRMVADLWLAKQPELGKFFTPNRTISDSIRDGVFVI